MIVIVISSPNNFPANTNDNFDLAYFVVNINLEFMRQSIITLQ